ncbi:Sodium-coupled monocarboxylate transporter 1 [Frankliniella fusca]|uniref:Sodium-coupled monocarboxylate transporter 1 n=1 Tax=Frankliniella fusca TaxID=407009 RepID=A0AAE1GUC1_9NEOP|nr:Sodium-coupled monocarboxylate transporter 1 [Frankliniella fusca]
MKHASRLTPGRVGREERWEQHIQASGRGPRGSSLCSSRPLLSGLGRADRGQATVPATVLATAAQCPSRFISPGPALDPGAESPRASASAPPAPPPHRADQQPGARGPGRSWGRGRPVADLNPHDMDQDGAAAALPTLLPGDILLGTTRFTDADAHVFDLLDYTVFGAMLLASSFIGIYFAFCATRKQDNTAEYLMGGKTMGVFPVSMSLIASYISGISLLGLPAEMYTYGTQYYLIVLAEALVSLTMAAVYLPVFFKLQITSSYEYLNMRFNKTVRLLGSCLFLVKMASEP